MTKML